MHCATRIAVAATSLLFGAVPVRALSAQSADTPACKLLSVAEIQKITGIASYARAWGMGPGEAVGGGSSCAFEEAESSLERLPLVGFSLIPGKGWTERRRTMRLPPGCSRIAVAAVGDDAFYESCPTNRPKRRVDPLYVKVGANDLVVEMDIRAPATEESVRNTVVALAKAVTAKLKK
jgi:hypothetical protein